MNEYLTESTLHFVTYTDLAGETHAVYVQAVTITDSVMIKL